MCHFCAFVFMIILFMNYLPSASLAVKHNAQVANNVRRKSLKRFFTAILVCANETKAITIVSFTSNKAYYMIGTKIALFRHLARN